MKVGILVTGDVGRALGTGFAQLGHEVKMGSRDPNNEKAKGWVAQTGSRTSVKAFNSVGSAHMVHPKFPGGPPDMFICGNEAEAKKAVTDLLTSFGWNTIDIGGVEGATLLAPLCILQVAYGLRTHSWDHAFKLLRK